MEPLYIRHGSEFRSATPEEIIARAQTLISEQFHAHATPLGSPNLTRAFLRLHLGTLGHEIFGIMYLDSHLHLIKTEDLFRGTLDGSAVYVRDVVHSVLNNRAHSVILYHNHPSGVATPSLADEWITQKIQNALALIDVKVIDHLIVADTVYSFAESGLL